MVIRKSVAQRWFQNTHPVLLLYKPCILCLFTQPSGGPDYRPSLADPCVLGALIHSCGPALELGSTSETMAGLVC